LLSREGVACYLVQPGGSGATPFLYTLQIYIELDRNRSLDPHPILLGKTREKRGVGEKLCPPQERRRFLKPPIPPLQIYLESDISPPLV